MIERPAQLKTLRDGLKASPVVALLGPRQCGKTTLARHLAERGATTYFDLEHPADLGRLAEPMLALEAHPRLGASWESFAIEQLLARTGAREAYYWRTQTGAELDLFLLLRGKRIGIEMKYGDAPAMTKSLHAALADLRLDRLLVVRPGNARFPLGKKIEALPLADCLREVAKLGGR